MRVKKVPTWQVKEFGSYGHVRFLHFSMKREGLDTIPVDSDKAKALVSDLQSPLIDSSTGHARSGI